MPRVVGEKPHPRGVIMGFEEEAAAVGSEFATSRSVSELAEIDVHEWDVLVTSEDLYSEDLGSLFVVTFADKLPFSMTTIYSGAPRRARPTPARHFVIPDDLTTPSTPPICSSWRETCIPAP
jgi:hypothetical protein